MIFITAYPERFLTGERPEPAFLVSKPYQPATVSALVSQALVLRTQRRSAQKESELRPSKGAVAAKGRNRHHCRAPVLAGHAGEGRNGGRSY